MTHLFVALVVRHREAVLDGDDVSTYRSQESANHAFLSFVPSYVRIAHVEEHQRWDFRDHVVHVSRKGKSVDHLVDEMDVSSIERFHKKQNNVLCYTSNLVITSTKVCFIPYGGAWDTFPFLSIPLGRSTNGHRSDDRDVDRRSSKDPGRGIDTSERYRWVSGSEVSMGVRSYGTSGERNGTMRWR